MDHDGIGYAFELCTMVRRRLIATGDDLGAFATAIGLGVGWLIENWRDYFFWSLLMTLLAYLAVAGGILPNVAVFYGWGIIGAICGSMSVLAVPKNQLLAAILMGVASCLAMIVTVAGFRFPFTQIVMFDVGLAALLGAMFQPCFCDLHYGCTAIMDVPVVSNWNRNAPASYGAR